MFRLSLDHCDTEGIYKNVTFLRQVLNMLAETFFEDFHRTVLERHSKTELQHSAKNRKMCPYSSSVITACRSEHITN